MGLTKRMSIRPKARQYWPSRPEIYPSLESMHKTGKACPKTLIETQCCCSVGCRKFFLGRFRLEGFRMKSLRELAVGFGKTLVRKGYRLPRSKFFNRFEELANIKDIIDRLNVNIVLDIGANKG